MLMSSHAAPRIWTPTLADLSHAIEEGHIRTRIATGEYVVSRRDLRRWLARVQARAAKQISSDARSAS
jgi:hypothetical protein